MLPILLLSLLNQCPPPESITPCKCISRSGPQGFCQQTSTEVELQSVLKSFKGYALSKLTISGVNASTWQPEMFKDLHVKYLDLEKIEVDDASFRPGLRHFQGLEESLETLEIKKSFRNGHRSLINLRLDHLSHLVTVILEDNHIPEVGNDWFASGPSELANLMFERNGIESLGDKAFSSLSNLRLLAVAGNHLREIARSMLPRSAGQLRTLDLAYNKLRNLPSDLFSDMPSLVDVNLDFNLIHTLQEDTFSFALSKLDSLSLEGNPLECDEKLKWICRSRSHVISGKCVLSPTSSGRTVRQFCEN